MSAKKSYFSSLDRPSKDRYLQKIASINNIDPYEVQNKDWSPNVCDFPAVTFLDLVSYLVLKSSAYTLDQFKSYKSLEAYNQFVSGWVKEIKVKKVHDKSLTIITGRVMHSQRVRDTPLMPWIIAQDSGTVESAHCNCMAGLGETCTHVGALLFAVECYIRHRETKTVTQEKAYWIVPPTREVSYEPVSEIDFTSASSQRKNLNMLINTGKKNEKPVRCNVAVKPTETEIAEFYSSLSKTTGQPAILSIIDGYSDNYVPKSLDKEKYPLVLTELHRHDCMGIEQQTLEGTCSSISISCTPEQAQNVERETRQQSKSKAWYRFRSGRVTASKLKDACHTSLEKPSSSLIKTICYPEATKFVSVATKWGSDCEEKAKEAYSTKMKERHMKFVISDSGFVIHPEYPHLGASPDGVISCDCCEGKGCLEIKCPYSARDKTVQDAAREKNFCCSNVNGIVQLKKSHGYYYQVQAQIFLTDSDYCDFVVWTPKHFTIERVYPDQIFWEEAVQKASKFFRMCILLELVGKHFTATDVNSSNLDTQDYNEDESESWCYCGGEDEGEMICCDNNNCKIQWYHFECLGLSEAPVGSWYCPQCIRVSPRATKIARCE